MNFSTFKPVNNEQTDKPEVRSTVSAQTLANAAQAKAEAAPEQEPEIRPAAVSPQAARRTVAPTPRPIASYNGVVRNVLHNDVSVVGTLKFVDELLVDGAVDGEIASDGDLTVGENAVITAEIRTKSVVVHGKVTGNMSVTESVELKRSAQVFGDIRVATLSIEPGAVFVGHSYVGAPAEQPRKSRASAASGSKTELDLGSH